MNINKKGFTLIEMLAVIGIVAVLVAVIVPTVSMSTDKAKAAVDAANLRSTLGVLNSDILINNESAEHYIMEMDPSESEYKPGAELYVVFSVPGIIDVYYIDAEGYYGLDYLSAIAQNPNATGLSTAKPTTSGVWYKAGVGVLG